jgi:hypothetical protein
MLTNAIDFARIFLTVEKLMAYRKMQAGWEIAPFYTHLRQIRPSAQRVEKHLKVWK